MDSDLGMAPVPTHIVTYVPCMDLGSTRYPTLALRLQADGGFRYRPADVSAGAYRRRLRHEDLSFAWQREGLLTVHDTLTSTNSLVKFRKVLLESERIFVTSGKTYSPSFFVMRHGGSLRWPSAC